MMSNLSSLLLAIRRDPSDDTLRLACADELADQPTTYRTCPCGGKKGWVDPNGGYLEFSGTYPKWTICPACSGSGQVADTEYADWSELVRVQVEFEQLLRKAPRWEGGAEGDWRRYHRYLIPRLVELLAAHPHWQVVMCPGCEGAKRVTVIDSENGHPWPALCSLCSGSGTLPVTVERGFARRLALPTMDSVGREESVQYITGRVRRFTPHPTLSELVRGNVWLRTVREVEVKDRVPRPVHMGDTRYVWDVASRDRGSPSTLPTTVWLRVQEPFPTAAAANTALWEVVAELVRGEV